MVQAVIFGLIGLFSCFLLEYLSIYATKKKCRVHEIEIEAVKKHGKLRYLLYFINIVLWIYSGKQFEDLYLAFTIAILFSLAILISMVDLQIHIIPNEFVLAMIIIGVAKQIRYFDLQDLLTAIGCMVGIGALFLIVGGMLGLQKIGAGDVKLAAAMGFVLGYPAILTALLVMCISVLVYCFIGFSRYRLSMKSMLPYAPFLMIGMVTSLIINTIA